MPHSRPAQVKALALAVSLLSLYKAARQLPGFASLAERAGSSIGAQAGLPSFRLHSSGGSGSHACPELTPQQQQQVGPLLHHPAAGHVLECGCHTDPPASLSPFHSVFVPRVLQEGLDLCLTCRGQRPSGQEPPGCLTPARACTATLPKSSTNTL